MPSESSPNLVGELLRLGVRNVGRNLRRSLITGSMIAIAVAGVIFFKGYGAGIERVLVNMAVEGLVGAMQVQRTGYFESQDIGPLDLDLEQNGAWLDTLKAVPNVEAAAPRLLFTGLISNGNSSNLFVGLAIDPKLEPAVSPQGPGTLRRHDSGRAAANRLVAGEPLEEKGEESVMLTDALAKAMNVKVGDSMTLLARTRGGSMDTVDLTVKGLFHFDDPLGNHQFGVMPLQVAQRLLHMENRVTAVSVAVRDRQQLEQTMSAVTVAVRQVEPATSVYAWQKLAPYYRDVVSLQNGMLDVVFIVVILIVLAGITNTMVMSTLERRREIGTLMSMGFRRKNIVLLFVIESVWLGLWGAIAGTVLGIVLVRITHATGINFSIPAGGVIATRPELRGESVLLAMGGAVISAMIAALWPAYRASRLQPTEALRAG